MPKRVTRFICMSKSIFSSIIFDQFNTQSIFVMFRQQFLFSLLLLLAIVVVGTTKYSTLPYRINWRWMKEKIIIRLIIGNIRYRNLFQTNYGLIKKKYLKRKIIANVQRSTACYGVFFTLTLWSVNFFLSKEKKTHFQICYFVRFHVGMPS